MRARMAPRVAPAMGTGARLLIAVSAIALATAPAGDGGPRPRISIEAQVVSTSATTPKVVFGAFVKPRSGQTELSAVTALENKLGRKLAVVRMFDRWDDRFLSRSVLSLRATGHSVFLSVQPKRRDGTVVLWRSIANARSGSRVHNEIVNWALAVKGFGRHMYFNFSHEPESRSSRVFGTSTEFKAAWHRIVTIFRNHGVTNAEYVWVMTDWAFVRKDSGAAHYWYPGDSYLDDIGVDSYNWFNCRPGINNPWTSLASMLEPAREFAVNHPTKRMMIPEWGSREDPNRPGRKAIWINSAATVLQMAKWSLVKGVFYYDSEHGAEYPACKWWVDSSTSSLNAFTDMGTITYFTKTTG
jgi:hypothetical protein